MYFIAAHPQDKYIPGEEIIFLGTFSEGIFSIFVASLNAGHRM